MIELDMLRYFIVLKQERKLPLFIDSIGVHEQENVNWPNGYPYYHWLQTIEGEGRFQAAGQTFLLPKNTGVLLPPNMPRQYEAVSSKWRTAFVTFGGSQTQTLLASLGLEYPSAYQWPSQTPLDKWLVRMTRMFMNEMAPGLDGSSSVYRFLSHLKTYAENQSNPTSHHNVKLQPLIEWLNDHYQDSSVGLEQMAGFIAVSPQYLNKLFRNLLGTSPYAYLIQLRISKAKNMLATDPLIAVKQVAEWVGFYDASHFVATFRKSEGITPEQFKLLHHNSIS
ncbi:AraC family transcriptional regulator [Paenibacillus eucommiae]|uniref:AraC-like DNA-binding protein n=1 Tax=Paenibacillus eucommiae TaxID=1355755 RepID=A0ABS4INF2_9BACL|nr:AraC family transcriptional regulator [Paenibacillus eucommiae]MBP1989087.1 AraC-like DNA-binding protein [Paenibacillus eucommiae]